MAKIEEILEKYQEEKIKNVIKAQILGNPISVKGERVSVMELVKVDNDELLFSCNNSPIRVKIDEEIPIKAEINPYGEFKYNYLFWAKAEDIQNSNVNIHFLRTGRTETHTNLDIAYDDDIIYYVANGSKSKKNDDISQTLYSWFAFNAGKRSYVFIETFPNSNRNFRIHGLRFQVDVFIEDSKWVLKKINKKPFPSKYSDFRLLNPIRYEELNFVEASQAKEALETINLRDKTTGDTVLTLWETYTAIEQKRASEFQSQVGELYFSSANQKKDGVTTIKL